MEVAQRTVVEGVVVLGVRTVRVTTLSAGVTARALVENHQG